MPSAQFFSIKFINYLLINRRAWCVEQFSCGNMDNGTRTEHKLNSTDDHIEIQFLSGVPSTQHNHVSSMVFLYLLVDQVLIEKFNFYFSTFKFSAWTVSNCSFSRMQQISRAKKSCFTLFSSLRKVFLFWDWGKILLITWVCFDMQYPMFMHERTMYESGTIVAMMLTIDRLL